MIGYYYYDYEETRYFKLYTILTDSQSTGSLATTASAELLEYDYLMDTNSGYGKEIPI